MFEINYYEAANGRRPFSEWLENVRDRKARALIRLRLDRLMLGDLGRHRPVGEGVGELKIDFGPGYRVYFGRMGKAIVLLLCGGDKSSQDRDIERAKRYFKEYRSEHEA
jgi:putative addiction module killer protein